jgi:group II intron reverse transcriptase/maturase
LYNREFYCLAYQNIYANNGGMTQGSDSETIDGMSLKWMDNIIASMKDLSYQPKPARRTYIKKKNGKLRPLGIASSDDKLVQEVVRLILESIYEPAFSKCSHGFRPGKSYHTALMQIHRNFAGVRWFVEGDISACFDSFDHHVLISILRRRIADENFIALVWKILKAGYMEQWTFNRTYSGTPQGSGAGPLLANIYLNELDTYMEEYKKNFDKGIHAKPNLEYQRKQRGIVQSLPAVTAGDPNFKRVWYCRYADDFIIGVNGSKQDAEVIKADIGQFLAEKLKLTMSVEKTKITHSKDKARFLGYDITVRKRAPLKRSKNGVVIRTGSGQILLCVPYEKWRNKLLEYKAMTICKSVNGGEKWNPIHRGFLINKPDIEIIRKFNAEIRSLYNFYRLAHNASVIGKFAYIMEYSMYKTYGRKYEKSVRYIIDKYSKDGEFRIPYDTKTGVKYCVFHNTGFGRNEIPLKSGKK